MKSKINKLRKEKGLSMDQLAEMIGLEGAGRRAKIHRWERGVFRPSLINAKKLADALGCNIEDLFEEDS